MNSDNKVLVWLFSKVWKRRLLDTWTKKPCKVVKVRGWKSALIDRPCGSRETVTFITYWNVYEL